jgi:hypothetical protein
VLWIRSKERSRSCSWERETAHESRRAARERGERTGGWRGCR